MSQHSSRVLKPRAAQERGRAPQSQGQEDGAAAQGGRGLSWDQTSPFPPLGDKTAFV